ncbi:discoidin domain-containing protein [Streptosporangium sp. NPDC002721]|uniref:galactose-binding domain-containing protein n=1 Tax=Streptosporangium sp. NPDC002721 TaxID=3366188 RepID=UPI0036764C93
MAVSRRRFMTSVMSGSALAAVSSSQLLSALGSAAHAASPPGDVVGKITVGYQGWFACKGDAAPINGWWHWSQDMSQSPSPSNNTIVAWPDMREYTNAYPTAYANLNNGRPATLFSSYDQQTVDTHFRWMRENNIDTAALQRFNPMGGEGPTRDAMAAKVRAAAEANGRKYYIMYDVTDWTNMQPEIKTDWLTKMRAHTASSAYAVQNGKPVVGIWGFGFNDPKRPWAPGPCLDVVNWFKAQGCYVMGGVPTHWRRGVEDSRPGFLDVYHAFHMISPWMVGRIGTIADVDHFYTNVNLPDQADCDAHGIDYQPCVLPGDVTTRQRRHGDFMWRQFYNMVRVGAQGIYISMFDEYNEGNQIAKTAETLADVPANSGMLALDEDGTACSADYYLRLTGDGGRMLKGQIALTAVRPTQPMVGGGDPTTNLARGKTVTASSHNQNFVPQNAVDGDPNTYWESANNAYPQWLRVDLGTAAAVGRVVLKLPPQAAWQARTQTLSVQGSTNGSSFTTLAGPAGHSFDPGSGNTVTITFPAASTRYVQLTFTGNTGWTAAQLGELEVYGSVTGGDTQPPSTPGNLTVTGKTATGVSLSWSASTDNVGVTGYQVRRGGTVVATVQGTAHTVTGLSPATAYTFTVTAHDAAANASSPSNTVTVTTDAAPNANLARGKATSASSHTQNLVPANTVDGDANSYWESANNAFPQWIQVDLGAAATVGRVVLKLPPQAAWQARTQTLSVQGSTNGSSFTTLAGSAGRSFDPGSGNTVTITFTATSTRYVRVNVTGNTGWPAGQLSEFEVYSA